MSERVRRTPDGWPDAVSPVVADLAIHDDMIRVYDQRAPDVLRAFQARRLTIPAAHAVRVSARWTDWPGAAADLRGGKLRDLPLMDRETSPDPTCEPVHTDEIACWPTYERQDVVSLV